MKSLSWWKRPWRRRGPRVLLTEIGGVSGGDQALYVAATRRLTEAGCRVSLLCRRTPTDALRRAGLHPHTQVLRIQNEFLQAESGAELLALFKAEMPEQYAETRGVLSAVNVVMTAPGGRLMDGYPVGRNLLTTVVAQDLEIPVITLHQSIGPLRETRHRKLVADVLDRCLLTVTRDDISFALLHDLGVPPPRAFPSRDLVFAETYPAPKNTEYDLGINARFGFNGHARLDVLILFVREYLRRRPGARVLVYSNTNGIPPDVAGALSQALPCDVVADCAPHPDHLRDIGRCRVNVADSFHGVIFSMMAGRPVVCCQTDFDSWKLQGTLVPGIPSLDVLPGFIDPPSARDVLDRVLAMEADTAPFVDMTSRFVDYCAKRAEDGWSQVCQKIGSL